MNPKPQLQTQALYEQVAELLRQRIFAGELEPGAWVDEIKLSSEYGISRTPMREAIKVLAAEGLLDMRLRRGAYVTEISAPELGHIFHLLALLEGDACAVLAAKIGKEALEELTNLHKNMCFEAKRDTQAFFEANQRFHFHLLALAGNPRQIQMVMDLRKVMKLHRRNSLLKTGRTEASIKEHEAILKALKKKDPELARSAMQTHIMSGYQAAL